MVVDTFGLTAPDGNPVFVPTSVARVALWVDSAEAALARLAGYPSTSLSATERFELRRLQDLRAVPAFFRRHRISVLSFQRVNAPLETLPADDGSPRTVLRIGAWR
jgi:hypothetical protein